MQEMEVQSLSWEDPLEEGRQPTPVFLLGKSPGQRSVAGYIVHRGPKESETAERTVHCLTIRGWMVGEGRYLTCDPCPKGP